MELESIFKVESLKNAIHVFDKTGKYHKVSNPFAYGGPNLNVSDFHSAVLSITPPNEVDAIDVDVWPSLPNCECHGFEILAEDLDLNTIESGVWSFSMKMCYLPNDNNEQCIVTDFKALLTDNVWCCIENRKTQYDVSNISSDSSKKTIEMEALLDNAIWAACKGDYVTSQNIMDLLNNQCNCCK